jgi:hypothetical protein
VVLFFILDFTFVCPSEILAFDHRSIFKKRDCEDRRLGDSPIFLKNTPWRKAARGDPISAGRRPH